MSACHYSCCVISFRADSTALPNRIFHAVGSTLTPGSIWNQVKSIHWPKRGSLFRPLHGYGSDKISDQLAAITSPVRLTRNEMIGNVRALQFSRDAAARRVGILASQAPNWAGRETNGMLSTESMEDETTRVYKLLCVVLETGPPDEKTVHEVSVGKRKPKKQVKLAETKTVELPAPEATAQSLLDLMTVGLPEARNNLRDTLKNYGRPSFATRYWPAFLLLPPCLYYAGRLFGNNKEWLKEQLVNAKETVRGFLVQWVWEPIEHITKTMRGGGEGLGVAPETVKTDRESLDRMVMDLGKDYYHMNDQQLEKLKDQVNAGDLESVLKVYESEMRAPIKNAIFGYLIRTLLIQVQKTKTDLSVALLQLDSLLQSQQLTFAFVGIAPSILVLWMVWGWIRNLTSGAKRGKGRKRRYFYGMRSIERLLITSTKEDGRMNDRDRGMLIVDVSGLRVWAAGIKRSKREAFLSDIRLFEDQNLDRDDKLRVVDRIWRCWGIDGTHSIT